MGFDVKAVQKNFFDRKAVIAAIDRDLKKALSKFGAFVRTRARSSIRKAPRAVVNGKRTKAQAVSPPGRPPYSHTGDLKRFIYFSFDPVRKSVVIGPVLKAGGGEAPALLEYGGAGRKGKYAARPYMRPAFAAELPNAPKGFRSTTG